jgi:hypothetical protein
MADAAAAARCLAARAVPVPRAGATCAADPGLEPRRDSAANPVGGVQAIDALLLSWDERGERAGSDYSTMRWQHVRASPTMHDHTR